MSLNNCTLNKVLNEKFRSGVGCWRYSIAHFLLLHLNSTVESHNLLFKTVLNGTPMLFLEQIHLGINSTHADLG